MLEDCGYKDTEHEDHSNKRDNNTLNELAHKALVKNKTKLFSTNSKQLSMYHDAKPKLGTLYAQGWSKNKVIIICSLNSLYMKVILFIYCIYMYIFIQTHPPPPNLKRRVSSLTHSRKFSSSTRHSAQHCARIAATALKPSGL